MKYYKFIAQCCGNTHTYYQQLKCNYSTNEAKNFFQNKFSWMKVLNCEEITIEEYRAYIKRTQEAVCKSDESIRNKLLFEKEYVAKWQM